MKTATLLLLAGLTVSALVAAPLPFDTAPAPVKTVAAEKPASAPGAGFVALQVTVKEDGSVADAKVLKTTHPDLAPAARDAMLQWKFNPAKKDGKPVEATIVLPVRFT